MAPAGPLGGSVCHPRDHPDLGPDAGLQRRGRGLVHAQCYACSTVAAWRSIWMRRPRRGAPCAAPSPAHHALATGCRWPLPPPLLPNVFNASPPPLLLPGAAKALHRTRGAEDVALFPRSVRRGSGGAVRPRPRPSPAARPPSVHRAGRGVPALRVAGFGRPRRRRRVVAPARLHARPSLPGGLPSPPF